MSDHELRDTFSAAVTPDHDAVPAAIAEGSDRTDKAATRTGGAGNTREPVAWAALREDGDIAWIGYTPEGAADGACGRRIVPLYRLPQPMLTDAEREAVEWCVEMAVLHATECDDEIAALRGLLERTK